MGITTDSSDIAKELKRLARMFPDLSQEALELASKELAEALELRTPYDPSKSGVHAKDNVVIGKYENEQIIVGYSKLVSWRMHFVEYGTVKQPAQGFVATTEAQMQQRVFEIVQRHIIEGLGL